MGPGEATRSWKIVGIRHTPMKKHRVKIALWHRAGSEAVTDAEETVDETSARWAPLINMLEELDRS
jgi:hypothetical protein